MSQTPKFDAKIEEILKQEGIGEEELAWCRKFRVPPSKMEPVARLNFLNGFNTGLAVFWKKDVHGEPTLSAVHPDSPIQIMKDAEWYTTNMDAYGRDVTIDRPVMDQMWDMMTTVPINATRSVDVQNSVLVGSVKATDCYLVNANLSRHCFYSYALVGGEDCADVVNTEGVARSWTIAGSRQIADSEFLFECRACSSCGFLFDCWNCEYCFGAVNQRHKKFLWFGEQLTEGEWKQRRAEVDLSDHRQLEIWKKKFYDLWHAKAVWPETFSYGNTDCDGERVVECTRCQGCYWQGKSVDCLHCRFGIENNGCLFTSGEGWEQECYTSTGGTYGARNKFCLSCSKCVHCEYSVFCVDCENCFGCFGMKRSRFCIFNKQYSEEAYWQRVDDLKCRMLEEGSYGEFFPAKFSPSGFQFSVGDLYFSYDDLKKYNALVFDPKRGQVLAPGMDEKKKPLVPDELPDTLEGARAIVGQPIHDPAADRNYAITQAELALYEQRRWAIPREHFVTRLQSLVRHSNSPLTESLDCSQCKKKIVSFKNFVFPVRKVYCRECYLKHLEAV